MPAEAKPRPSFHPPPGNHVRRQVRAALDEMYAAFERGELVAIAVLPYAGPYGTDPCAIGVEVRGYVREQAGAGRGSAAAAEQRRRIIVEKP